jgi:hypothetical protein
MPSLWQPGLVNVDIVRPPNPIFESRDVVMMRVEARRVYINQPCFLYYPRNQCEFNFLTGNMADLSESSSKSLRLDEKSQTLDNIRATEEAVNVATASADDALKYAATKSRLLRTTDWHVLPWLCAL